MLVTGGARSGKSGFAERLAALGRQPVVYVATAEALDAGMRARIAEHRSRRPAEWQTVEAPREVGRSLAALPGAPGTVLLDDLGLLVSNHLGAVTGWQDPSAEQAGEVDARLRAEIDALAAARLAGGWDLIVVTQEVGLGVIPETALGQIFRDALGRANQILAAQADAVYLLVAGIPVRIKPAFG